MNRGNLPEKKIIFFENITGMHSTRTVKAYLVKFDKVEVTDVKRLDKCSFRSGSNDASKYPE